MHEDQTKCDTFGLVEANNSGYQVHRSVVIWLCLGLFLVYMQIVIGGITRLTGSGLSITEWEIVTGTFPPFTGEAWQLEFDKYKDTPQFTKVNQGMEMGSIFSPGSFKFIYFWEYLHRLWARSMGFVFIFPFLFFYFKKMVPISLVKRLGIVIGLAALAATFGWIMVASGLIDRPWVNAYKLSLHLCIGISVFIALWWAFIRYIHSGRQVSRVTVPSYVKWMLVLLIIQIFLGGVMSGTRAALFINTWPDLNGEMIPRDIFELENWNYVNFNEYEKSGFLVTLVQFLHRCLAYFITGYAVWIMIKTIKTTSSYIKRSYNLFLFFLTLQVFIGIITLIKSVGVIPVLWGVLHQGVAVLVLASYVLHYFYTTKSAVQKLNT